MNLSNMRKQKNHRSFRWRTMRTGIDGPDQIRAGYPNRIAINRTERWFMPVIVGGKPPGIKGGASSSHAARFVLVRYFDQNGIALFSLSPLCTG
jgi:hypothetical protein